jgi:hypothetical protein
VSCLVRRPTVRNSGPFRIIEDPGFINIRPQVGLKIMVAGHSISPPVFFAQTEPGPAALHVDIFDVLGDSGADAGEGVNRQRDEGPIAESDLLLIDSFRARRSQDRLRRRSY